jgi:pimeloyl-ACP methyl ester carboxylesterase
MEDVMTRKRMALLFVALLSVAPLASAQTALVDNFFTSNGVKIRYVDVGRGDPVVLIHGFSASLDSNFGQQGTIDALAKDFRVIALDCRGHGKSDKPHDPKQYGINMIDDVVNLLDELGISRAHIVGYSMGGAITGKFVTTHPNRVLTATFGGSAPRMGWTEQNQRDSDELATSLEHGQGMRPLILRLAPPNEPKPSEEAIQKSSQAALGRNDALALAAVTRGNREQVVTIDQVKAIKAPVLAVIGSADPLIVGVRAFKALLPAINLVVLEGATHSGPRGVPARPEFAAAIRDFIAAHRTTNQ